MRIIIIDDQEVVHTGIQTWCEHTDPRIQVVDGFLRPAEYFAAHPAEPDNVDVIVMEMQIGGGRPDFEALRKLAGSQQRVIVYSRLEADEVILTCLDLGAATYLVKSEGKQHLIDALLAAPSPAPYVGPRMGKALLGGGALGRIMLSRREIEVLTAWLQTDSKELVAERLIIAPTTVRTHLQRIRAKYASIGRPAPTKSALLARAIEDGIVGLDQL